MKNILSLIKSKRRRLLLFALDLFSIALSFGFSWALIVGERITSEFVAFSSVCIACTMVVLAMFGAYYHIWRYAQIKHYFMMALSIAAAFVLSVSFITVTGVPKEAAHILSAQDIHPKIMCAFVVFTGLLSIAFVIGIRMTYRVLYEVKKENGAHNNSTERRRTLIVGAGQACWILLEEILSSDCEYAVVGVLDDDKEKIGRNIQGTNVYGPIESINEIIRKLKAEVIIIAIPSAASENKKRIVRLCNETGADVRIIPEIHSIVSNDKYINQMRKINTEDLLGREAVIMDIKESAELINRQTVMVTGGGGSIGSELCRQIMSYHPSRLVIIDISENSAYDIQQELLTNYGTGAPLSVHISSVRDFAKMDVLFDRYRPALVFHAAAHKHVPLMENDPEEALKNNISGTYNIAYLANKYKVKRFLLISSDKAVNPTNVMGATKRFCEMLIQHFNKLSDGTEYCAVRFGNVLGSNGSVIPLFNKLIEQRKDLPVTHPEITRYFMTIPEAVSLVLRAGAMAKGGEIFVLDMGTPVKIVDLARNLIRLHGLVPDKDIKIKFVGLRPGEKLYEELLMGDNLESTKHGKIFIEQSGDIDSDKLMACYDRMCAAASSNDNAESVKALEAAVSTFKRAVYN